MLWPYSGVAIGSSIGHSIGGFFGGSSDNAATAESQGTNDNAAMGYDGGNTAATNANAHSTSSSWGAPSCEQDARSFTKCLDQNGGNMQICGWYLEQLVRDIFLVLSYLARRGVADVVRVCAAESVPAGC